MFRLTMILTLVLAAIGCGSPAPSASTGGTGGQATTGGAGGTTISGLGGTGGTTSTAAGGTGGVPCVIPGAVECGPEDPEAYPDPLASYNAARAFVGYLNPIPGTAEVGAGAGAVRLGPWPTDRDFAGLSVVLAATLPDPIVFAAWSEPQCGLPADSPHDHAQSVSLADVQQEDVDGAVRATITTPIHVPAGESFYLAIITTTFGTAPRSVEPTGDLAPRAMWWGVIDNDCNGEADTGLGWAWLDAPTAPGVSEYHYDLAFTLIEMAPPAPPPIIHGDCCPRGCKCPR